MEKKKDEEKDKINKKPATRKKKPVDEKINKVKEKKVAEEVKEIKEEIPEKVVIKSDGFNLLEVILIMLITLFFGAFLGSTITYATSKNKVEDKTCTEMPSELEEFVSTYEDIVNNYYQEIDSDAILDAGISGMISFLNDKYSVYMNKEETTSFNQEVEGKYVGIGTEIKLNYTSEDFSTYDIVISNPFEGGPAAESGIKIGDIIKKVNDEDVTKLTLNEVSSKIKGESGTTVKVTVLRKDEEIDFNVVREEVEIDSVSYKTFNYNNKKVGYIQIDIFAANTANQFEKALIKLEGEKIDSLIIDVRDNAGGYLSTVTNIASMFLDKSKVIYQLDTRGSVEMIYSTTSKSRSYPVTMLINENSASASEILTGAMSESYGAKIVGVNSFGKGTVQKAYQLESGATVKYTTQKWLTPNGNWVNEKGIAPDVSVELDESYFENPSDETDNQLQEALKIVTE